MKDKKKKKRNSKPKPIAKLKEQETIKSIINASKIATDIANQSKQLHNAEINEKEEEINENPSKKRKISKGAMKKGHQILISQFHALQKQLEGLAKQRNFVASKRGKECDELKGIDQQMDKIREQIQSLGGIQTYQAMSLLGEKKSSNSTTTPWILNQIKNWSREEKFDAKNKLKLLDVGALHFNYKQDWIECTAIDLNPVAKGIQRQDFLAIQLEGEKEEDDGLVENFNSEDDEEDEEEKVKQKEGKEENSDESDEESEDEEEEKDRGDIELHPIQKKPGHYDVICFSLVINFVGDVRKRGKMLIKAQKMLREGGHMAIVLPLPCVENSRYMTEDHLMNIFQYLQLECVEKHHSKKLCYYWLKLNRGEEVKRMKKTMFPKNILNQGNNRNNFAIVL